MQIGVDTGGTFTDLVCRIEGGSERTLKVPSTPDDPSRAVLDGLRQILGDDLTSRVERFVHGTTVATNAVLERKGAVTGVLSTAGFRDVLEIGRQLRTSVYDLELKPETPVFLAPGARRAEVTERIDASGDVVIPLDESSVVDALRRLTDEGVEAVAVSLLFSFLNPAHERRIQEIAADQFSALTLSLSSDVDPAFREYERTVVTAFDAYTKPVLARYLGRMSHALRAAGMTAPLQVMQSRGGVAVAEVAMERSVRLFLSGPAAGVIGGGDAGRKAGFDAAITVDIGGTSCDIALVTQGKPLIRPEGQIDGYPVRTPMVDVNAIGSGGGSVAWIDQAGGLRVGPHSAGAVPGPACYGAGADTATVTDASLVLGYLNPGYFAGGSLSLNAALARQAIEKTIATPLGLTVEAAAEGIHQVVNAQMAEGMRLVSIRQGFDPRDFALVPLGGAGPVHAIALATELGIARIVVPRYPGVLSATGLLTAPIEHEASQGFPADLSEIALSDIGQVLEQLDGKCAGLMAAEDTGDAPILVNYSADVCYVGQSHYLEVPLDLSVKDPLEGLYENFMNTHRQVFGYATSSPARLINLRSVHRAATAGINAGASIQDTDGGMPKSYRTVFFAQREYLDVPIFERDQLVPGQSIAGPAIIEQADTTTVVQPDWRAVVDDHAQLLLTQIGPRVQTHG